MTLEERMAELGVDLSDLKPVAERRYDRDGHPVTVQAALMDYYADVIDRMETRLVNLTGERDYLIDRYIGCEGCTYDADTKLCEEPCVSCENMEYFEWSMPEDWRPDDD